MLKVFLLLAFVVGMSASVNSAEVQLDTETMQTIEDLNKSLSSNISLKDAKGATSDAKELTELFAKVEQHFLQKGDAQNAVDLSKKSKDLTVEIINSIAAKNFEAATDAATSLSRTCRTCHTFYKKE